jgi:hypothetical protein
MPHSEIHKKRLIKNLILLAMIFGWCALIWVLTMVKMANAEEILLENGIKPGKYHQQRFMHQKSMEKEIKAYEKRAEKHQKEIVKIRDEYDDRAARHQTEMDRVIKVEGFIEAAAAEMAKARLAQENDDVSEKITFEEEIMDIESDDLYDDAIFNDESSMADLLYPEVEEE